MTVSNQLDVLRSHWQRLQNTHMRKLFQQDADRFNKMSVQLDNLLFDFSKNHIDEEAMTELLDLAQVCNLAIKRSEMFAGEKINVTEGRSVLHTALRNLSDQPVYVDGVDVMPGIKEVQGRMAEFCDSIRSGEYLVSGNTVTDVVNIGIGGSDLGPKMVAAALAPFAEGPNTHFVSNVDPSDLADVLATLDPKTTLFNIASKTFTTRETMANANVAKAWITEAVGETMHEHFSAVSTNLEATRAFGIGDERTFGFWDWVGGRFSVWSAIGLPVMMAIGPDAFEDFLSGAHKADNHFLNAEASQNIPVIMALISVWNRNVCGHASQAVLPYDQRLSDFPRWLQQLAMESNGKTTTMDSGAVTTATSPVVFGEPGTNGQHAFYQLLHQGTDIVPCDFLVAANSALEGHDDQHRILLANCFAQSEALMAGKTLIEAEENPHRVFAGNRPSNTFLYDRLDPGTLGLLMAFYEHKTFVEGVVWSINSFDQYGVELGKELATALEPMIDAQSIEEVSNGSTKGLLAFANKARLN